MSKITGDGSLYLKERAAADSDVSGEGQLWVSSADNLPQFTTKDGNDTPLMGGNLSKNAIIGGDFRTNPWQRGVTFAAVAAGSYTADRWRNTHTGAMVYTIQRTADGPTVAQAGVHSPMCYEVDVTTADASIAAGDFTLVQQFVEGYNSARFGFGQAGTRYVTLSFWHKHTKTGTYCVSIRNSPVTYSYVAEYTQSVTDTWEKATITIPVETGSGTWNESSGIGLIVTWCLAGGSTYQTTAGSWASGNFFATSNQVNAMDSTSNFHRLALVQLEAGPIATPFETRNVGVELAMCERYYEYNSTVAVPIWSGDVTSGNTYYQHIAYNTQKRTNATVACTHNNASGFSTANPTVTSSVKAFRAQKTANSTVGGGFYNFSWTADAEL